MLVTNLPDLRERNYQVLGLVEGTSVYAKHLGKDIAAGFKNLVGGELKSYTEMIEDAKESGKRRLLEEAQALGADGVLNLTYSLTNLQTGTALVVIATGTAIKFMD